MNYILLANDAYMMSQQYAKIVSAIQDTASVHETVYEYQSGCLDAVLDDADMPSMFADVKCIRIKQPLFLTAKEGLNPQEEKHLLTYLQHANPDTTLVFELLQQPMDARKSIVKTMRKHCQVVQPLELDARQFRALVMDDLKRNKIRIQEDAFACLIDRLPMDLAIWQQELQKLICYDKPLDRQAVEALIVRELFGNGEKDMLLFSNAILAKDMKQTFRMWNDIKRLQKEAYGLMALIAVQFRFLYQVKYLMEKGYSRREIALELGAKEYRVQKTEDSLLKYSIDDILEILHRLAELDSRIKTGRIEPMQGFELFLLQTTRS